MAKDTTPATILHTPYADASRSVRHVFVRDYVTLAQIGVWDHEKDTTQQVRISVDLSVQEDRQHHGDQLDNVVCYNQIVEGIEHILAEGHINLVETLAERIADFSLQNRQVIAVRVKVEKLEAVKAAASVGVEIERHRIS
ncbi:diguanylate cyclase [Kordiimonas sediminis]|uniref:7,8-dihydroneopterin aldolase n=1 Tax=Kordiimonas sediminis TaxID=1735581 RepID=A0A919E7V7_9PROT|nr:dihydroneopterin aldolase [Kordiimonas sediminis]GHF23203.1 diguanylate cyclase [Kordiimonas sediminis]